MGLNMTVSGKMIKCKVKGSYTNLNMGLMRENSEITRNMEKGSLLTSMA